MDLAKTLLVAGGVEDVLTVEDVFSNHVYEGDSTVRDIINNINLVDNDGMTWIKSRTDTGRHTLYDTLRGAQESLFSDGTDVETTRTGGLTAFNEDGFSLGNFAYENGAGHNKVSWTFRKAPRFFDVVTYTGDGVVGRNIAHELGVAPGMIYVKHLDLAENWVVYHKSMGATKYMYLNVTNAEDTFSGYWDDAEPTDSVFTVGGHDNVNKLNGLYVAYIFADDPLGAGGDDGMIACGEFTTDASTNATVSIGWEPQYILLKSTNAALPWVVIDCIRGIVSGGDDQRIYPNATDAESSFTYAALVADGVEFGGAGLLASEHYIFMAIRRPMKTPETADEVFAIDTRGSTADGKEPAYRSDFPVDMALRTYVLAAVDRNIASRLTQGESLATNTTGAEIINALHAFDYSNGWYADTGVSADTYSWMWKRATGFFDVVVYTGDSVPGREVPHNLGVAPEMMLVKTRNDTVGWLCYTEGTTEFDFLYLNLDNARQTSSIWYDTAPTDTVFTLNNTNGLNSTGDTHIAYLFATLAGISKVGSYTGNGTSQTIDCGFSAGARFVLIKRTDLAGNWHVWDTLRGIVAGDDPHFNLNDTAAQVTNDDSIDPESSGFIVNQVAATNVNVTSAEYIFYAVS